MLCISQRYKQMAVSQDIFEDVKELRERNAGATTSDILADALRALKQDIARRNAMRPNSITH